MKPIQHVTVFGANGKIGRLLVEYALADNYEVTAFVHNHHDLPNNPNVHIVKGDVHDANDVRVALEGTHAVLSALSSWGTPDKDVLSKSMTNIIPAMQERGIARIVSLTGAEARTEGDKLGLIHRLLHAALTIIAGKVLADGERHILLLKASDLDWTVVRSPVMRSGTSDRYKLQYARSRPWEFVNRRAVARAMVDELNRGKSGAVFIKQQ